MGIAASFFGSFADRVSARSRAARAELFRKSFTLTRETQILDLGTEWGTYIARVIEGTPITPANVYAADIFSESCEQAHKDFGFTPVRLEESGPLPFSDKQFDIVFCNSVIEHVTLPKEKLWEVKSGRIFRERALARQQEFADEIRRVGKGYFVQTPNRWFPLEPHTRLPFAGWLPRGALLVPAAWLGLDWTPDWNLLTVAEMELLFPDARIEQERLWGMVKSIIAVGTEQ